MDNFRIISNEDVISSPFFLEINMYINKRTTFVVKYEYVIYLAQGSKNNDIFTKSLVWKLKKKNTDIKIITITTGIIL